MMIQHLRNSDYTYLLRILIKGPPVRIDKVPQKYLALE